MKIVKFEASWCGPCKSLSKMLEGIDTKFPIEPIDIDEHIDLSIEYGIRSVPTLIMINEHGAEVKRHGSFKNKEELTEWLND
jgi:thioredoxin 1